MEKNRERIRTTGSRAGEGEGGLSGRTAEGAWGEGAGKRRGNRTS